MNEQVQEIRYLVGEAWKGTYNGATTYGNANVVQDPTGLSVYRSLKPGNVGHALTDTAWWFCIIDLSSIKAESDRIAALNTAIAQDEQLRVAAEQQREQAEQSRVDAEAGRVSAEAQRVQAESNRVSAENSRVLAEQGRVSAESARVQAESNRVSAEASRVLAEQGRVSAENQRAVNEENRQAVFAEDHRIAVADHQTAEADHTTAVADHETAVQDNAQMTVLVNRADADHVQAGQDHTRAESDHTTAAADHTQAGTDHQTAAADHQTAGADHTQSGNDHTRAESDHTRAESDHAAVEVYVDSLGAFDISAYHATGGVLAKYADLAAALDSNNGGGVPQSLQKGGMSVKFVQSSDNKYVQYRLMAQSFTTDVTQWQGVDKEPIAGSENLVNSDGVAKDFGILERRTLYSKTINLYDKDSLENRIGAYLDINGAWHTLAGMLVTPFIPVTEGVTYYLSGWGTTCTMRFVTAYDSSYTVLPEKGADNSGTVASFTCPSGVAFIRISTYKALKDIMICTTNGASYVPFEAITTKELYEQKLNKTNVVNSFSRSETDVLSCDANGLLIAKTANKKITRFLQADANRISSESYYTWGKDRLCAYVKQTDSYTYKIMINQYDASKNLIGYGTIWPKNYTFDNALPNAVYFKVQVLRRNADDTADVNLSVYDLSGFEVYINYDNNDLDGLTKLDNSIFTLLNTNNGMLTKAVCKWGNNNLSIKCRGSLTTQAMVYQYDKDFISLGYTTIWEENYIETPKENAVYFDIRVAKMVNGSYQPITQEDLQYIDIYSNYVPYNKNLTINMLGDSLTAEGYITDALTKLGYKVNNYGVSGTSIAGTGSTSFISRFSAMTDDCDIVLVLGGVNDWRNGVYMGNFENLYDNQDPLYGNTFFSALHILCGGLKDKYINDDSAKLVIFATPMHNQFSLEGYPDLPEFVIEDNKIVPQSYGNGTTLDKYVEAIKKVCKYYAIPVIDLYARSYIAPIQDDNKTKYTKDGLHPNTTGGKLMAEAIMRELIYNV